MSTKKDQSPPVARDYGMEEICPEDEEERASWIFDDPYLFEVYESIKDDLHKERSFQRLQND